MTDAAPDPVPPNPLPPKPGLKTETAALTAPAEKTIAFQGAAGAYSDLACRARFPDMTTLPCSSFEVAFEAVTGGVARYAMIPVDNTIAGRVADIHRLLPEGGLHIVGEHFERVRHQLLALPGVGRGGIRTVHSHVHALGQCRRIIREIGARPVVAGDTAGAAAALAAERQADRAVIASSLAAEIYGLEVVAADVEDADHNTTRFLILSSDPVRPPADHRQPATPDVITTFLFRVRNIPAALYKAMGGFATNGINMTKLESYMVDGQFTATQFYADVEGHPEDAGLTLALEELGFFASELKILGVYPAHPDRHRFQSNGA